MRGVSAGRLASSVLLVLERRLLILLIIIVEGSRGLLHWSLLVIVLLADSLTITRLGGGGRPRVLLGLSTVCRARCGVDSV